MTLPQTKPLPEAKNLRKYLSAVQDESVVMQDLLTAIELLHDSSESHNTRGTLITLAREKAFWLNLALDSVNLPPP